MGYQLGDKVGYRVRFQEQLSQETRVKFLTDGMLLREAILDPKLSRYAVVVLDEAHERTVNSDVLLAIVKDIAKTVRKDLKIVIMSATLEIPKFRGYFGDLQAQADEAPEAKPDNLVKVEGRTFAIEILHCIHPQ